MSRDSKRNHNTYRQQAHKKRRLSVWSFLAPAATLALFVVFFFSLSNSCLTKGGCGKADNSKKEKAGPANNLPAGARAKVKAGDSVGSIADRFHLTVDEITACNPNLDPRTIQPGQFIIVSAASCEGKDLAEAGANPDPLAGETSVASTKKPKPNATAAADPSLNAGTSSTDNKKTETTPTNTQ